MEDEGGREMKKRKILKVLGILFLSLLSLYIFLLFALGHILHSEFYNSSFPIETIPGLSDDFVPQGVTVTDDGTILITKMSSAVKE